MAELVASLAMVLEDDEDYEDIINADCSKNIAFLCAVTTLIREDRLPRIEDYAEILVPKYGLDTFRTFFRVSKATFEIIAAKLAVFPELQLRQPNAGRPQVKLDKKLLMCLWYLGSQETVRSIADRFNVSLSTLHHHIRLIIDTFTNHLKQKIITWPDQNSYKTIIDHFERRKGFPGVLGAVDGTHIRIRPPHDHNQDYLNRKRFHSIILQGICRENRLFIDNNVGWPGRVHDARVLRNSEIWERGPAYCGQHHILGDGAYPCKPWLLTPYRDNGHLNRNMRRYNNCLSGIRVIIENTFGILKGRFRRLQLVGMKDVAYISKVVVAACVLHNICVLEGDDLEEYFDEDRLPPQNDVQLVAHNDAEGQLKRLQITRQLALT